MLEVTITQGGRRQRLIKRVWILGGVKVGNAQASNGHNRFIERIDSESERHCKAKPIIGGQSFCLNYWVHIGQPNHVAAIALCIKACLHRGCSSVSTFVPRRSHGHGQAESRWGLVVGILQWQGWVVSSSLRESCPATYGTSSSTAATTSYAKRSVPRCGWYFAAAIHACSSHGCV
jgi:hypothetical protein